MTETSTKLWKVTVYHELVVRSETEGDAVEAAKRAMREEDAAPLATKPIEIKSISELPKGWNGTCRPWGERDPMDRTIAQQLSANRCDYCGGELGADFTMRGCYLVCKTCQEVLPKWTR